MQDYNISANPAELELRANIESRSAILGVIGLGYVGLPLCVAFAKAGFQTIGFDLSTAVVGQINSGQSHIGDITSKELSSLINSGKFSATSDMSRLAEADIVSICVPTPLSKTRDPDLSFIASATEQVAGHLRRGQLVILESTTYPGTTREVMLPRFELTGLELGLDFFLAYSPERIDPGNSRYNLLNTPKIVGGLDAISTELSCLFYKCAIQSVVPVTSPEIAEMVKLHENTFRAVNIALANETAMMCDRLGIDVWEVIQAASSKPFGFMPFFPGPGIGGHCIPLDPHYLSWKMNTLDYKARFIDLATEINSEMPRYVVQHIAKRLNDLEKSIRGSRILIIGVSYKPNIGDTRESPALEIISLLKQSGSIVDYHDPFVPTLTLNNEILSSVNLSKDTVHMADCVIIVTNHSNIDYQLIDSSNDVIISFRGKISSMFT